MPAPGLKFGAATPPAIFPPILGLLGLGLAWRQASVTLAVPGEIGELILGAVSLLFLFALLSYLTKVARRPGVIVEDMRVLPGRGGVAAMLMALCVFATGLVPHAPEAARVSIYIAIAGQAALILLFARLLFSWPPEQRRVTPVQHLILVGMICAPLALIPLGVIGLSEIIYRATGLVAALIWGVSLAQLTRGLPPPPLRPTLAIHLAPASLLGTVAMRLGHPDFALVFAIIGVVIFTALAAGWRKITQAGFSAMWGSFTFPLSAFAGMMLTLGDGLGSAGAAWIGAAALLLSTGLIPWIAYKVIQSWARGALAQATNAARA